MTISEKLSQAEIELKKSLPFINEFILEDCINLIKTYYIMGLSTKNDITLEEALLLKDITCCHTIVYEKNLEDLTSKMHNFHRENSKGASVIKKFFVEKTIYDKFFTKDDGNVYSLGAKIVPTETWLNQFIVGIGDTKFKYIEPRFLITLGRIN